MAERRLFKKLPPVPRRRILDYIDRPSFDGWRSVRDIVVSHGQTLQDVMDVIDRCWPGMYPSAILVARAARVVDRRDDDLKALEM